MQKIIFYYWKNGKIPKVPSSAAANLFNPLMPNGYLCTSIQFIVFKKKMLQAANADLFNPLVPKAHK